MGGDGEELPQTSAPEGFIRSVDTQSFQQSSSPPTQRKFINHMMQNSESDAVDSESAKSDRKNRATYAT